jgi:hypothetical protein
MEFNHILHVYATLLKKATHYAHMFLQRLSIVGFKVGSLHPVACTRSGSGFPSNATLF